MVKDHTYMDHSAEQEIDIRADIEKTLIMFGHKLREGTSVARP
ncbi:MAG TPA: hypothetical protein VGR57_04890 [Ktedonobacterales bacterium]|nr:hypothetical protein [Ktedonobacterales bacterium]